MYDIKVLIDKMKRIANIHTNVDLAQLFGVSYNTLNTWIKRKKLPQEIILNFCKQHPCSLDYLLLNKKQNLLSLDNNRTVNNKTSTDNTEKCILPFYGTYIPLGITSGNSLKIDKHLLYTPAYYLLRKNSTNFISLVMINPFNNTVLIEDYHINITLDEFNAINIGLIIQ